MILVTGASGYIGSHTLVELINAGHTVIGVDNFSNSSPAVLNNIKKILGVQVPFMKLDLSDQKAVETLFEKYPIQSIIHFAAYKSVGESVQEPLKYYRNNLLTLINLLEACKDFGVDRFVFSSSCTVYGEPDSMKINEDAILATHAASPYGNTKKISEQIIQDYCKIHPLNCALLRYFNPIGSHESGLLGDEPNGVPNNLIPYLTKVVDGELPFLSVFGGDYDTPDGTCIRDYIHVVDLAKAHQMAIEKIGSGAIQGVEAINLGTGVGKSVLEVIQSFEAATGEKVNYKIVERRAGDITAIFADPSKAKDLLGWATELDLKDMLKSAWKFQTTKKAKH